MLMLEKEAEVELAKGQTAGKWQSQDLNQTV